MKIASVMGFLIGEYIAEKISTASDLLNYKNGSIFLHADFYHEGGEACFWHMEAEIKELSQTMFPALTVVADAGW